ncbi:MAG TPA: hypothetical protein VJA18_04090 [Candidatus Nanoarchaeia archaeon]|nr:hypothetical protein [Candidatus Nanoarchaeia archaeon]
MYQEIEAGYCVLGRVTALDLASESQEAASLDSIVVQYFDETITCLDKLRFWEETGFKKDFARECKIAPDNIGMIKTILFSYLSGGQEKYFLVSTLAEKRIDFNEVRVELGLSTEEAQTLDYKAGDATLEAITGKKRGAVSPLLDPEYLHKVSAVYFTRDLMDDATKCPEKRYDVPRSRSISEFWHGVALFTLLRQRSSQYKTAGDFEKELQVTAWKVKKIDQERAGYNFLFGGTIVKYRGQEYQLTNPPMRKEGFDRKRKELGCAAFPISRTEDGTIEYEYTDRGKKRLILPIPYELLEQLRSEI